MVEKETTNKEEAFNLVLNADKNFSVFVQIFIILFTLLP